MIFFGIKNREGYGKYCPFSFGAFNLNRACISFHNGTNDRKSKSAATGLTGSCFIHTVKTLKNVGNRGLRNTNTRICKYDLGIIIQSVQGDSERSIYGVVFDSVFDKIKNDLI